MAKKPKIEPVTSEAINIEVAKDQIAQILRRNIGSMMTVDLYNGVMVAINQILPRSPALTNMGPEKVGKQQKEAKETANDSARNTDKA